MKLSEMREHTIDELNEEIISLRKKLFELRMNLSLHKLENTSEISRTRSQIAQFKTVIREKQLQK
ncbi:MAG: 50S ribosomal protein L29 [Candidatus Gastranaerophilales bacterium]|nr:50S ribosomal protein L29 [Candidatus Gastranaerophilales bacterium]